MGRWVVDGEGERGGRTNGDDSRAEFDADGHVVVGGEAAFAEADGELGGISIAEGSESSERR